ncbi:MAG: hypothetical protein KAR44_12540 [Candidatus Aegiribacteria sp.]|nr:hypothetical protein [Candidatus Aegiribacteria sp.]
MSLVISELSRHGIVMVGDTALVDEIGSAKKRLTTKVQYFPKAMIGITCWGLGGINEAYLDEYLAEFIANNDHEDIDIESLANLLSDAVNHWFDDNNVKPNKRIGGLHIGGYCEGDPKLWHIHRSDSDPDPQTFKLFKDWPESKGISQKELNSQIRYGQVYIFNGKHKHCNIALEGLKLSQTLSDMILNLSYPEDSVLGRVSFLKHLLRTVATMCYSTLQATEVSDSMVFLAFDRKGLITRGFSHISEIEDLDAPVFLVDDIASSL